MKIIKVKSVGKLPAALLGLVVVSLLSGCAFLGIGGRQPLVSGEIPKPGNIVVHDFITTAADVPADSVLAGEDLATSPQTPGRIAEGRKLGNEIAAELVKDIRALGMPAQHASPQTQPQLNDLVLRGYLLSVNQSSAARRILVGLGSGESDLKVLVETDHMTTKGLQRLGSDVTAARRGKRVGTALGVPGFLATKNPEGLIVIGTVHVPEPASGKAGVTTQNEQIARQIAEVLKKRFQKQRWSN